MCLAIPGQIQSIDESELRNGHVSFGGMVKDVCLAFVPEAQVGDYVIVHVGFAISKVDEAAARETIGMYEQGITFDQEQQQNGSPLTPGGDDRSIQS